MKHVKFMTSFLVMLLISCQLQEKADGNIDLGLDEMPESPVLFGENLVSSPLYERDLAISPGIDEIIYTLGDYKQSRRCLVAIRKYDDLWTQPEVLNISGQYQDIEPFFSLDGNRLYFASNRPIYGDTLRHDYNIWYTSKVKEGWGTPIPLDTVINSSNDEFFPSLSENGNLYFTATRDDGPGREDIFISEYIDGQFTQPRSLPESINSPLYEFNAFISPAEDYILFSSFGRADGMGGGDLYMSVRNDAGEWIKAWNLGPEVNSEKLDYCPFVDPASRNMYFTSERVLKTEVDRIGSTAELTQWANRIENGFGNIYRMGFQYLKTTPE